MQAIIMAAGKSTRTYPLTITRPKPLLNIVNKPILEHQLDALVGLVDEVVLVVWYRKSMIEERFGASYRGLRLTYVDQSEQLGTGHAILQCKDAIRGPFIAMNGDDLYAAADLTQLAGAGQAALAKRVADPRLYGIFEIDSKNRVKRIVEKPVDVFSNLANVGAYAFTPRVFEVLARTAPSERGEIEITSAIQTLATESVFHVIEMGGHWLPIGYPWHLFDATKYLLENDFEPEIVGKVSPAAHLNGSVHVGAGSIVREGVVIDGPCYIGEHASIGPNAWIRPYSTIGDFCHVGHACEIKSSILMNHAAVPHLSYVGDSIVGERTNLGAGTITANFRHDAGTISSMVNGKSVDTGRNKLGCIFGDDVHTGINTSIYPGRKFWPGTHSFPGESIRKDVMEVKRLPQDKA